MFPEEPTPKKVLFPNPTPKRYTRGEGENREKKDDPLSFDTTMFPTGPTATKVLFPNPTPLKIPECGGFTISKDDPLSVDLTMFTEPGYPQ